MRIIYLVLGALALANVVNGLKREPNNRKDDTSGGGGEVGVSRVVKLDDNVGMEHNKEELDDELNTDEPDLSETTKLIFQTEKKNRKIRKALIIYAIIDFLFYFRRNIAMALPAAVNQWGTLMDVLSTTLVKNALDESYHLLKKNHEQALRAYMREHPDRVMETPEGSKVVITTPKGEVRIRQVNKKFEDLDKPEYGQPVTIIGQAAQLVR